MPWPPKIVGVSWQENVRTVGSVISTLCILIMCIAAITTSVYAINTVNTLQASYSPLQLESMLRNVADTIDTVHSTTVMLKSGKMQPVLGDVHRLILSLEQMSVALETLRVHDIIHESVAWRNMSVSALVGLAKSFL